MPKLVAGRYEKPKARAQVLKILREGAVHRTKDKHEAFFPIRELHGQIEVTVTR
jgi:hypothetical protein